MSDPTEEAPPAAAAAAAAATSLAEVAFAFTRLGFTAFGGPAAHLAMMEEEFVRRRAWLDEQHFLDLVAAMNLVPGPTSTEVAINLGLIRAGWPGMFVAGACFICPAMLIILPIAWAYVAYGTLPEARGIMTGINAAVVAIVTAACWRFGKAAVRDTFTATILVVAVAVESELRRRHVGEPELIILAAAALAGVVRTLACWRFVTFPLLAVWLPPQDRRAWEFARLAGYFLKVGATLFGSGYVLVSYLQSGVVEHHGWLTQRQLLDAVSVGQVTPGPLLTTATFIGYLRGHAITSAAWGGVAGGVVATAAIFLPAFAFVAALGKILPRVRDNGTVRAALDAMNAAVVALILVATVQLARSALWPVSRTTLPVAALSLAALLAWRVNPTWLVLAGAVAGWLATLVP